MKVYISGPMTGLPDFNFPAFYAAEERLRVAGYEPLNPAKNFNGDTSRPYAEYIRADVALLLEADAICLLKGWHQSRDAMLEVSLAGALGLPVLAVELV